MDTREVNKDRVRVRVRVRVPLRCVRGGENKCGLNVLFFFPTRTQFRLRNGTRTRTRNFELIAGIRKEWTSGERIKIEYEYEYRYAEYEYEWEWE